MKYLSKFVLIVTLVVLLALMIPAQAYAQLVSVSGYGEHNYSRFNQTMQNRPGFGAKKAYWPNGHYRNNIMWSLYQGLITHNLIESEGATPVDKRLNQAYGTCTKFVYTYRYNPPSIKVEGIELAPPFTGEVDAGIESDIKILIERTTEGSRGGGGVWTEISRSYSNQYHYDYVIMDETYKYVRQTVYLAGEEEYWPKQTLEVFMDPTWGLKGQQKAIWTYNPNWRSAKETHNSVNWVAQGIFPSALKAAGKISAPRTELKISYGFNSDYSGYKKPRELYGSAWGGTWPYCDTYGLPVGNETGDINGEFTAYAYLGRATLHADLSATDTNDDIEKPWYVGYIKYWDQGASTTYGGMNIWDWANRKGMMANPWEDGYESFKNVSSYDKYSVMPIGPYTMEENQDIRQVYAIGVGGIAPEIAWEKGDEYLRWYRDGEGNFDAAAKNALLDTGLDSLVQTLDRAYFCASKGFNIPDPPPPPDISATSGPQKVYVSWSYPSADYFKDPDTGSDDFKEWRIYRKLGNRLVEHSDDRGKYQYELLTTITDKNTTTYEDNTALTGESYHYYVTSADDGSQYNSVGGIYSTPTSLESSPYANRTLSSVIPFNQGSDSADEVLIVPNPYSVGSRLNVMNFTGYSDNIQFVNLPPYCTLKIYTATGDLIKTIEHTTGSGLEKWIDMRTDANQQPVSGVYILVVDDAKDINNIQLPKRMYKFVIVR